MMRKGMFLAFAIVTGLTVGLIGGCTPAGGPSSNDASLTWGQPVYLHLQDGFNGEELTIKLDDRQVFKGKPVTNPVLGLAKVAPATAVSNQAVLRLAIPARNIEHAVHVDLKLGAALGISLTKTNLILRQAGGFGYD